jgi:hypothetical protein
MTPQLPEDAYAELAAILEREAELRRAADEPSGAAS